MIDDGYYDYWFDDIRKVPYANSSDGWVGFDDVPSIYEKVKISLRSTTFSRALIYYRLCQKKKHTMGFSSPGKN